MKITILTYGSRGDVQPFLGLAQGLQADGYDVTLVLPQRFSQWAAQLGIPSVSLPGEPSELSLQFNQAGANPFTMMRSVQKHVLPIAEEVITRSFAACHNADLIIHSFLFTIGGHAIAAQKGIPDISVQFFPVFAPTGKFPHPALPPHNFGRFFNWLTHKLGDRIFFYFSKMSYKHIQSNLKTPLNQITWPFTQSNRKSPSPLLFAISPSVVPSEPEWGPHVQVTGYWFLEDQNIQPQKELQKFLSTGSNPICVTFGSMINPRKQKIQTDVYNALRLSKQRAIILTGWSEWKNLLPSDDIFFIEEAPHNWLLQQCSLVIHHGGAGTTAAGLRAGIPNIVIPFAVDQPFWAQRVFQLGAGPPPIKLTKLNAHHLANTITETLSNQKILMNSAQIGQKIREEDGIQAAISIIKSAKK